MRENEMHFLGVSQEEERVYRYFLRHPKTSLEDLHKDIGIAPAVAVTHARRLSRMALLWESTSGRLTPADPESAITRLTDQRLRALQEQVFSITRVKALLESLRTEQSDPDAFTQGVNRSTEPEEIRARITDWAFGTKKEVLCLAPYTEYSSQYISYVRPLVLDFLGRGIRLRSIMLADAPPDSLTATYVRELAWHGAEVRTITEAAERVMVSDRQTAIVPIKGNRIEDGALFTTESGLVANFVGLFERTWAQAEPAAAIQAPSLAEANHEILTAMCSGEIDDTAARRIGVSVRTYRSRIANLMRLLGADSRAQAALMARDRGWI